MSRKRIFGIALFVLSTPLALLFWWSVVVSGFLSPEGAMTAAEMSAHDQASDEAVQRSALFAGCATFAAGIGAALIFSRQASGQPRPKIA